MSYASTRQGARSYGHPNKLAQSLSLPSAPQFLQLFPEGSSGANGSRTIACSLAAGLKADSQLNLVSGKATWGTGFDVLNSTASALSLAWHHYACPSQLISTSLLHHGAAR
jgi:hypothetical protein